MTVLSGIGGAVNGAAVVADWSINHAADLQTIMASGGNGAAIVLDGNLDWNGNYKGYGHTPAHMPGEAITFAGSIEGTVGAAGTGIVDSITVVNSIETGAPIEHTVNFSRNGALTLGASVATDVAVPDPPTSIGTDVQVGTAIAIPSYSAITDVRGWTLTISASNPAYVSSDSAGGNLRLAGNVSATISVPVYEDDFAGLPAVNTHSYIRLYVTATTYWDIGFVVWGEMSDALVDIETPAVVAATMNGTWSGYGLVDAAQARGYIKYPSTATWWGA